MMTIHSENPIKSSLCCFLCRMVGVRDVMLCDRSVKIEFNISMNNIFCCCFSTIVTHIRVIIFVSHICHCTGIHFGIFFERDGWAGTFFIIFCYMLKQSFLWPLNCQIDISSMAVISLIRFAGFRAEFSCHRRYWTFLACWIVVDWFSLVKFSCDVL